VKPCQTTAASRFAHSSAEPTDGDVRWGLRRPVGSLQIR
jgi:hypothetical protein